MHAVQLTVFSLSFVIWRIRKLHSGYREFSKMSCNSRVPVYESFWPSLLYRNVEFLVSILHYSPAVVQPRKPFVQEISRKKDCTVFQCPPYIFPYILFPYVMHVLYLLYGGLQYLYMVPAQIYSMHVLLYHARSEICTISFLRMFIFSDWLSFYLIRL